MSLEMFQFDLLAEALSVEIRASFFRGSSQDAMIDILLPWRLDEIVICEMSEYSIVQSMHQ